MKEKIICFSLGLSDEDIEKGKASFYGLNKEAEKLEVFAINKSMLTLKVGDALASVIADSGVSIADKHKDRDNSLWPDRYRVVVVLAQEREQVFQVMRSFKAVLSDPQNIIFAVITETALSWTFEEYAGHLHAEHESMKTRKP
ncbi:MAG: hypothetical protein CVU55_10010 [Deltaproteobacteria bacterium HGW-Deltaproteobacteria-13]|jgi:hypothetical protein|nr:MAG: hypothetical protein CVU55_10010 [Deltaproteobacteria bacterium HGW-Deltaproteobacteria-13]